MYDTLLFILGILPYLLEGVYLTLYVSTLSFLIGFILSAILTPTRLFTRPPFSWLARTYIEGFRGTPLLVQLFVIYFGLPALGLKFDAVTAGVIALGLNSAAYQAEILRSSIKGIPESQFLAAESLGLTTAQIYRYVVLPQAVRTAIPTLVNEFVTLVKESSLISVIGVVELTRRGEYLVSYTFRALEVYLAVALIYFVMCAAFSQIAKLVEKKFKIPGYERGA